MYMCVYMYIYTHCNIYIYIYILIYVLLAIAKARPLERWVCTVAMCLLNIQHLHGNTLDLE